MAADHRRDAWFAGRGYLVLRFWNHDVLTAFESVLDTLFAHLQDRHAQKPALELASA